MINIIVDDITTLAVDAIVNAANSSLLGGGGVDGAIHRAAGPELLDECRKLHGCRTGEAKITGAYRLPARYVIHTVGPIYSGLPEDRELLADCYINSLDLAMEKNLHSIAFPVISTGVYGYPVRDATVVSANAVKSWLMEHPDYDMDVTFCCFSEKAKALYDRMCPVCFSSMLDEIGKYEICDCCGWEDDPAARRDPDMEGGANHLSLNQARAEWEGRSDD